MIAQARDLQSVIDDFNARKERSQRLADVVEGHLALHAEEVRWPSEVSDLPLPPEEPGVYLIASPRNMSPCPHGAVKIGKSRNLRGRLAQHLDPNLQGSLTATLMAWPLLNELLTGSDIDDVETIRQHILQMRVFVIPVFDDAAREGRTAIDALSGDLLRHLETYLQAAIGSMVEGAGAEGMSARARDSHATTTLAGLVKGRELQ